MIKQPSTASNPVLGIDFGTSNSAVAWSPTRGAGVVSLKLEGESTSLPSTIFYNSEDQKTQFGRDAIAEYLRGTEGRLMRSLKSLLGSPLLQEQTAVNGEQLSFQDIITRFLCELKNRAQQQIALHDPKAVMPQHVVMGRPVHFVDDDPVRDQLAENTLRQCALAAGFKHVSFQFEPIAAALDYEQRVQGERLVLVVDIGGGTSDFTVVRLDPKRQGQDRSHDILATTGVHIGGTDFDQKLNLEEVMPLLGYRHTCPKGREVPSSVFFDLATWHLINWCYSPKAVRQAQELRVNYTNRVLHQRLMTVHTERLGHFMANEVEQSKIKCSNLPPLSADDVLLDLSLIEGGLQAHFNAQRMAKHLQHLLNQVVACAQQCVAQAGVAVGSLDAVYLTGGSSALQPFQAALKAGFANVPLVEGDLFGGVAAGLACSGV
jgi:hypothetical chaperone protein